MQSRGSTHTVHIVTQTAEWNGSAEILLTLSSAMAVIVPR